MPWIKPSIGVTTNVGRFYCNACNDVVQPPVDAVCQGAAHGSFGACDRCGVTEDALHAANVAVRVTTEREERIITMDPQGFSNWEACTLGEAYGVVSDQYREWFKERRAALNGSARTNV